MVELIDAWSMLVKQNFPLAPWAVIRDEVAKFLKDNPSVVAAGPPEHKQAVASGDFTKKFRAPDGTVFKTVELFGNIRKVITENHMQMIKASIVRPVDKDNDTMKQALDFQKFVFERVFNGLDPYKDIDLSMVIEMENYLFK